MTQILLGCGNKARHGKDTAAEGIAQYAERNGLPFMRIGWADALRKETTDAIDFYHGSVQDLLIFGPPGGDRMIPDWVKPSPNPVPEPGLPHGKHSLLLQWWGTEYRRAQNPNYWVDKVKEAVVGFEGIVVIPDTRFINEAVAVEEMGGVTIRVLRLNEDGTMFSDPSRDPLHRSETELNTWNWDFRIIAKTGQVSLVKAQAIEILKYQMRLKNGWTE